MDSSALEWQKEIYLNGFAGLLPAVPVDPMELEKVARSVLSPKAFAYIAGGAGSETTVSENRRAFESCRIVPRMLCNVGERDTTIDLFGRKLPTPLLLSPIGVLELAHAEADMAVARASTSLGIPFIFSNQASFPMEACSGVMKDNPRWFQLYWSKNNDLVRSFLNRAERSGCDAIVVTLDTTLLGWRTRDLDLGYLPFLEGKGIAQYTSDPVFTGMLALPDDAPNVNRKVTWQSVRGLIAMAKRFPGNGLLRKIRSGLPLKAVRTFISTYSNPCTTWEDLKFLRDHSRLPLVLKGILHPDDARQALDLGMNGIIVSNHGGRQVDGAISTLEALPRVVDAVQGRIPVLLDSGVRGGADVFKALALGATAVCIGRPYAYGLAIAGERGVYSVMRSIMADFELTMGLAGCKRISEIGESAIRSPFVRA